jgi:hypothetical protein
VCAGGVLTAPALGGVARSSTSRVMSEATHLLLPDLLPTHPGYQVRKRIQEEKEAQERIHARRAAPPVAEAVEPNGVPSPTSTRGRRSAGRQRPGAESGGEEDNGYVPPSKRVSE